MIYRIDVRHKNGSHAVDPEGISVGKQIAESGIKVGAIQTARVFFIETAADIALVKQAAVEVLADPIVETAELLSTAPNDAGKTRLEIHLKPGVMDPVAGSTQMALAERGRFVVAITVKDLEAPTLVALDDFFHQTAVFLRGRKAQ